MNANLGDLLELPDGVVATVLNMGKMEPAYYDSKHVPWQQYHVFQEHMLHITKTQRKEPTP